MWNICAAHDRRRTVLDGLRTPMDQTEGMTGPTAAAILNGMPRPADLRARHHATTMARRW